MRKFISFLFFISFVALSAHASYIEGPSSVKQYCGATIRYYFQPPGSFYVIVINQPEGALMLDSKTYYAPNGYKVDEFVMVFSKVGVHTVSIGSHSIKINVTSNPLINVEHTCPYGTTISNSEVYSGLKKSYTLEGSSTAKISESGILTYPAGESSNATITVTLSSSSQIYKSEKKTIELQSHDIKGYYNRTNSPSQVYNLTQTNMNIPYNQEIRVRLDMPNLKNYKWLVNNSNVTVTSYDNNLKELKFIAPSQGSNSVVVTYTLDWGCCGPKQINRYFIMTNMYSISVTSGILKVSKDSDTGADIATMRTNLNNNHTFEIFNALTGIINLKGTLNSDYNEIDISKMNRGIYAIRIQANDHTENYKFTIN